MPVAVRRVTDPAELEQVFRLRYDVYVGEMGRTEPNADHERRTIQDQHDKTAFIIGAFGGPENRDLVGTIRFNGACDLDETDHAFWRMRSAGPFFPQRAGVTTKLIVCPKHRSIGTPIKLAAEAFREGYLSGLRFCFIDCNEPRRPLFEALGFRKIGDTANHPRYGEVHVMGLNMADWAEIQRIKSPLLSMTEGLSPHPEAAAFTLTNCTHVAEDQRV